MYTHFPQWSLVYVAVVAVTTVTASSCPLVLQTSAQVERRLLGKGFHRELETVVQVGSNDDVSSCWLLVKEVIPPGAYVDPNQLAFLCPLGGPGFYIPQTVNVETPEHQSPRVVANFYTAANHLLPDGRWLANFTVPIHLRYHRARSGESYSLEVEVKVPHPSIFLLCEDNAGGDTCSPLTQLEPCPPSGQQFCEFLPIHSFSTSEDVSGVVPVGNTDLLDTVLLATTCLTAAATLLLLTTLSRTPSSIRPIY
ncbi:hypothetical protein Pcinc_019614 [Petrolisthes cinctipes]|uniref:Phosphatidylinositol-glycan biosynthesis class X protein n=1 Tax=Petrolisthes cinctipes TaxID=88211 RepID=A0AAE1FKW2_PETCI|nr:hypothetical protein Pcinc_019614 [Petrolisthes cinctipes]